MEIENKLAINDIAYTFEDNQIKEHIVRKIIVAIDNEKQEISYFLSDDKWHNASECYLYVESIFSFLKEHIDRTETAKF